MVTPRLEEVGHRLALADEEPEIIAVTGEKEARYVGAEAGLVEIEPDRIRLREIADTAQGPCESARRARPKLHRVGLEVVPPKDRPRPTDDGVRVDVGAIVEIVVVDQPVPQPDDRIEVVDPERIGRSHRRDEAREPPPLFDGPAARRFVRRDVDLAIEVRRHGDYVLLPDAEPPCELLFE